MKGLSNFFLTPSLKNVKAKYPSEVLWAVNSCKFAGYPQTVAYGAWGVDNVEGKKCLAAVTQKQLDEETCGSLVKNN